MYIDFSEIHVSRGEYIPVIRFRAFTCHASAFREHNIIIMLYVQPVILYRLVCLCVRACFTARKNDTFHYVDGSKKDCKGNDVLY